MHIDALTINVLLKWRGQLIGFLFFIPILVKYNLCVCIVWCCWISWKYNGSSKFNNHNRYQQHTFMDGLVRTLVVVIRVVKTFQSQIENYSSSLWLTLTHFIIDLNLFVAIIYKNKLVNCSLAAAPPTLSLIDIQYS